MSIAQTIQQRVDSMSEHDQLKMLEYANHIAFLREDTSDADVEEYDRLLNELLMKRYQEAKAHPERSVSWQEVKERVREKYGWE